jgi:hypothetical protein
MAGLSRGGGEELKVEARFVCYGLGALYLSAATDDNGGREELLNDATFR